jgi:putative acyl-CoA dehydrogenase
VHGGNGFIMENAMARLYREAPLNSIWEGTSNMMCMDVLRAMQRDANCRDAFIDELRTSRGISRIYDRSTEDLADRLRAQYPDDGHARGLVTRMAHALQAGEMLQHGDGDAADLFVRSRLGMDGMHVFGALPSSEGLGRIVEHASVISH